MKLGELSKKELKKKLSGQGLGIQLPPYTCLIKSAIPSVMEGLQAAYRNYQVIDEPFYDFRVQLKSPGRLRRWIRPQVQFFFDEYAPFLPLPYEQAFPMLEWGLNWCIANHDQTQLIVHSAVVAKEKVAVIFPGEPGRGKSTLTAIMCLNGYRLLSDELACMDRSGRMTPVPRPISLKNRSIQVIKGLAGELQFTREVADTSKGSIAHLEPPEESLSMAKETALCKLVIFPNFQAEAETDLAPVARGEAFMRLTEQSFNGNILGEDAFTRLEALIEQVQCFELTYSKTEDAVATINKLVEDSRES